jgi:hypothetical protein
MKIHDRIHEFELDWFIFNRLTPLIIIPESLKKREDDSEIPQELTKQY